MPFTFSHPAILLPVRYYRIPKVSVTALAIGSIVPDFEYFFRLEQKSIYSHTWLGALWFDLPLALLLCFGVHSIVKRPFIDHLPRQLYLRLVPTLLFNWPKHFLSNWLTVIISLLAGIFSHLVWDKAVHHIDFYVNFQTAPHHKIDYRFFHFYSWWFSSISGLGIVLVLVLLLPHQSRRRQYHTLWVYWCTILLFTFILFYFRWSSVRLWLGNAVISFFSFFLLSIIVVSATFHCLSATRELHARSIIQK